MRKGLSLLSLLPWLAGMALVGLLPACDASDTQAGGYERLKARPEAELVFPRALPLLDGGHDAEMTVDGRLAADYWSVFGSDAPMDEVLAFYESELAERGWEKGGGSSGASGTHETGAQAWHTDDMVFRLGFWKPESWTGEGAYTTIFEIRLIEKSLGVGS